MYRVGVKSGELDEFVHTELEKIAKELATPQEFLLLSQTNVAPAKPRDGEIRYADGVNWNPGSGRAMYRFDSITSTWKLLG